MIFPLQNKTDLVNFYGNPDVGGDGMADEDWSRQYLTKIRPPWHMYLSWEPHRPLAWITVNKQCAMSLAAVLQQVAEDYEHDQGAIEKDGLHLFGGCFNFRVIRGGHTLSTHAYAAAIDLNPKGNPLGKKWIAGQGMMPLKVVERFETAGWVWGGRFANRPDCQHFQAARL